MNIPHNLCIPLTGKYQYTHTNRRSNASLLCSTLSLSDRGRKACWW